MKGRPLRPLQTQAATIDAAVLAAIRTTHWNLSPLAGQLLEGMIERPEEAPPIDPEKLTALPAWMRTYSSKLHSLPVLMGAEKRRELELATVHLTRLVKSLPERILAPDLARMCRFYGGIDANVMRLLLAPPDGVAEAFVRWDLVDDGTSFKCLETNVSAVLGGWEHRFFSAALRAQPAVARVLAAHGGETHHRDTWRAALSFVVQEGHRLGHTAGGTFNLGMQADENLIWGESVHRFRELFAEVLGESGTGAGGAAYLGTPAELVVRDGRLHCQGHPVGAYLHCTSRQLPTEIYRVFKARRLGVYNGPLARLLGDKRSLVLLSEHEDSDLFDAEERRLIATHVPWCRSLAGEHAMRGGERVRLVDYAIAHRQELVLKASTGYEGRDIHLGNVTPPARWRSLVEGGAGNPGLVLQEYVASRPYLFTGEQGLAPYQVIWGAFCIGTAYAGSFLRTMPMAHGPAIINSAQGAVEGLILEV